MFIHDKRKAMQSIMSKRGKDGKLSSAPMAPELPTMNEGGEVDGRHAAAEDILMAVHEKSPRKLLEALANFHDMHRDMSEKAQDTTPEVPSQPSKEDEHVK